jgi:hypothetical protein
VQHLNQDGNDSAVSHLKIVLDYLNIDLEQAFDKNPISSLDQFF